MQEQEAKTVDIDTSGPDTEVELDDINLIKELISKDNNEYTLIAKKYNTKGNKEVSATPIAE